MPEGFDCGHDLALKSDSFQDFLSKLWHGRIGTVETGAVLAHRLISRAMPGIRTVTIRKPVEESFESLVKMGFPRSDQILDDLKRKDELLDEAELDGAIRVPVQDLSDARCCAFLWRYLLGDGFNFELWDQLDATELSLDPGECVRLNVERAPVMRALRSQVSALLKDSSEQYFTRIGFEPWSSWWADARGLAGDHYLEVNAGAPRSGHPFVMDAEAMEKLWRMGVLKIISCRVNGELVGYILWTLHPDLESKGVLTADQGPWYASPKHAGQGMALLKASLKMLRSSGVHSVQLHAPPHGRGAKLDRVFRRLGAEPLQHRWGMTLDG